MCWTCLFLRVSNQSGATRLTDRDSIRTCEGLLRDLLLSGSLVEEEELKTMEKVSVWLCDNAIENKNGWRTQVLGRCHASDCSP